MGSFHMAEAFSIQRVDAGRILALRHAELRPGLPRQTAEFDGDAAADTLHFGAFDEKVNVGCVSLMRHDLQGQPAYQLRGMATRHDRQGRGVGAALLRHAERYVIDNTAIRLIWCNARLAAVGFYERHGWRVITDEPFDVITVGPHHLMIRRLSDSTTDDTDKHG